MSRDAVLSQLTQYLTEVRSTGRMCAILAIDIDRFRHVNDRFGLDAGDTVLKVAAGRILHCLRAEDAATRLAGDRFAVALAPMGRAEFENVMAIAGRLRDALAEPIPLEQTAIELTATVGLCLAGRAPENCAKSMLQSAEVALVEARREGEGGVRAFSPRMRRETRKHRALVADLDAAFARGEFKPWFQPQIDASSGALAGFEALARWQHPDEGVLQPAQFLRALEAVNAAPQLAEAMLSQALDALCDWDSRGLDVPGIAINLSMCELGDRAFCDRLKWETDRHEIDAGRVAIEIKETGFDREICDVIVRNLHRLKDFGFRLDLDDFGTGRIGIAAIRRLRVDRIKIDRGFVIGMEGDPVQRSTVAGIARLAATLGIEAIAEGVESRGEIGLLAELGCACVQGYAIARPMPVERVPEWIEGHRRSLADRPPRTGTG
jgi:diguanylate cyclase (GGDEF)-like protein